MLVVCSVPTDRYRPEILNEGVVKDMKFKEFVKIVAKEEWPLYKLPFVSTRERHYRPIFTWNKARSHLAEMERQPTRSYRKDVLELWHQKDRRPFYQFLNGIMKYDCGLPSAFTWNSETVVSRYSVSKL